MTTSRMMAGLLAGATFWLAGCGRETSPQTGKAWISAEGGRLVSNPAYARRLLPDGSLLELPPQRLAADKASGELRVGVFGGAAAAGIPAGYITLARAVEAALEGSISNRSATVVDAAMPGLSVDEISALIRQSCSALKLDVVVLHPDPAHCGASATGTVIRLSVRAPMSAWIAAARESGAKVVVCAPGANLADCPPFKAPGEGLDDLLKAAEASDWAGVLAASAAVLEKTPGHALAHYLKGRALRSQSDLPGAASSFVQAVESDAGLHRFPPSTLGEFQSLATPDTLVVDANASIGKLLPGLFSAPGAEAFDTESMPTIEGWRAIGLAVAAAVREVAGVQGGVPVVEAAAFQQRLGHTRILALITGNRVFQHLSRPEYASQWQHGARMAALRGAISQFEQALSKDAAEAAAPDRVRERLAKRPDDLRLREILALHYVALNQPDPAIRELEESLKLHPGGIEARTLLARLLLQTGRNDAALAAVDRLVADTPGWNAALTLKAQSLLAAGKAADVVKLLEPVRASPAPDVGLLSALATAYTSSARTNDAVTVLDEAIKREPQRGDLLLAAAELAIQRAKVDEALGLLERARRVAPNAPEVDETSAVLFARMNDYPRAIALLRRAETNAPGRPRTQQLLKEALELQDKNARTLFEQAGELRKKGDDVNAIKVYRQALTLHPTAPALLENLAFVLATSPRAEARDGAESLRLARQRLAQMGDRPSPEALATLAAALAETGDFTAAVASAERAIGVAATIKDFKTTKLQEALDAYRKNTCWRNHP